MAFVKVGETTFVVEATGSSDITLPGSPVEDDVVIAVLTSDTNLAGAGNGIVDQGYTDVYKGSSNVPGRQVCWKQLGATPDTIVTVLPAAGGSVKTAGLVQLWRGADPTTPVDATPVSATGNSASIDPGSYETVTDGALRIIIGCLDDKDRAGEMVAPSGWTDFVVVDTGQASGSIGATSMIASKVATTAGAEDPAAFTFTTGTDQWAAYHLALRPAPAGATLAVDAGTFALAGQAAALRQGYVLAAGVGTFAVAGVAAGLKAARKIAGGTGSFVLTGIPATFIAERRIAASVGSFTLTGQATGLTAERILAAAGGTFVLTGIAADFAVAKSLTTEGGTFVLTGVAASLVASRRIAAEVGSFTLTGLAAGLLYDAVLVAGTGVFALSGEDAALTVPTKMLAERGDFALTGHDVGLTAQLTSNPVPLVFPITQRRKPKSNPYLARFGTRY